MQPLETPKVPCHLPLALSSFDSERFYKNLKLPEETPFTIQLQVHEQLPSTNDYAQQLMNRGAAPGTIVLALQQSQGKGSQGKQWRSPSGGLYLSLGLRPNLPAPEGHRLTLGSAWGIATVLNQQLALPSNSAIHIKWPNDLLLQGKKLGGILTESKLRGSLLHQAVIGIGLNWCNPVTSPGISLHSIRSEERNHGIESLDALAALVTQGLALGYCHWSQNIPPLPPLIEKYESLLSGIHRPVRISPEKMGTMEGINSNGELKVLVNTETLLFSPGTINLGYD